MTDLNNTKSENQLVVTANSGMDALIDALALNIYLQKSIYVGIDELPFWIRRFMAQHKKNTGHAPFCWTIGEPTTCDEEDRIEAYFKNRFPNAVEIVFDSNSKSAKELNTDFAEHGEYINSLKNK